MTSWFRSQATTGSGSFTRATPNRSAKTTYNRLQSPEGLVWIAEALGVNPILLQMVVNDSAAVPSRSRCAFLRKELPWSMIAELAQRRLREGPQ
ncbi:hypothetical protein [Falsarthrobacter nasiphocae]|uniref:Uncharacterized protein n=1 Tax=Falsarthrobacter nasiphocae TaxID=189863 RepID=A0AAE3YFZ5_9MICC|nr:hypothetical protein [Falsarthrobacter nasiphocae]MDR6891537.1 hypothetical protein [Falsarthrobacter nasiphocae]